MSAELIQPHLSFNLGNFDLKDHDNFKWNVGDKKIECPSRLYLKYLIQVVY